MSKVEKYMWISVLFRLSLSFALMAVAVAPGWVPDAHRGLVLGISSGLSFSVAFTGIEMFFVARSEQKKRQTGDRTGDA